MIIGASGGIGHMAVQLAKHMGARVFAVASGDVDQRLQAWNNQKPYEREIQIASRVGYVWDVMPSNASPVIYQVPLVMEWH